MTKNKIQGPGNSGVQGFLDRIFFLFKSQFRNPRPPRLSGSRWRAGKIRNQKTRTTQPATRIS